VHRRSVSMAESFETGTMRGGSVRRPSPRGDERWVRLCLAGARFATAQHHAIRWHGRARGTLDATQGPRGGG
jgi:hypothetical protein